MFLTPTVWERNSEKQHPRDVRTTAYKPSGQEFKASFYYKSFKNQTHKPTSSRRQLRTVDNKCQNKI